jgi:hypothetical protein
MELNLAPATSFMATHGRQLDRRRLELLLDDGDGHGAADGVLAALDAYRNADGGYGWGLEPDLRSAESQPTAAMHAFEVLAEVAPMTTPRAVELCDWLQEHTLADGGLPLALPIGDPAGCAPWWLNADPTTSALQMTAQVAAKAHLVARHDPLVASHPWLAMATDWCLDAIRAIEDAPHAYELLFALQFLDAVHDIEPEAPALLDQLGRHIAASGSMPVAGGAADEFLRPLDVAPVAGAPVRRLYGEDVLAADVDRLAGRQQADGGWVVDFPSSSPVAALEWRSYATVAAVAILADI